MLASLRIKNLALVETLEWSLSEGFISITGETGAGKSVIIGALNLLVGERADKSLIRTGEESCTVEAEFLLSQPALINTLLDENGVETCAEDGRLIVRRILSTGGSNRQFINGSPTTLAVLKEIGDYLVDLHGPHDHQSLLSTDRQLKLLDAYAGSEDAREAFRDHYRHLEELREQLETLSQTEEGLERELELLRHQVNEIDLAEVRPEEEAEIEQRFQVASNSKEIVALGSRIVNMLSETEGSITEQLTEALRLLQDLEDLDPAMKEAAENQRNALAEVEEVANTVRRHVDNLDIDEEQLAELEARINTLEDLKRKYGRTLEDVLAFRDKAASRLGQIEGREVELERLQTEIEGAEEKLEALGKDLSARRRKAAPSLAASIADNLKDLGFAKAGFHIDLLLHRKPRAWGYESVEFIFAPNPGEPAKPLKSIGSSGEISRVMLAVKTALAEIDQIPLLVFDEIDANVGGEIAHAVALKMAALGQQHQVLCITHLPQVAARAGRQFVVEKQVAGGRTLSTLTEAQGDGRITEIARMLGGVSSDSARAHARELLRNAGH